MKTDRPDPTPQPETYHDLAGLRLFDPGPGRFRLLWGHWLLAGLAAGSILLFQSPAMLVLLLALKPVWYLPLAVYASWFSLRLRVWKQRERAAGRTVIAASFPDGWLSQGASTTPVPATASAPPTPSAQEEPVQAADDSYPDLSTAYLFVAGPGRFRLLLGHWCVAAGCLLVLLLVRFPIGFLPLGGYAFWFTRRVKAWKGREAGVGRTSVKAGLSGWTSSTPN